MKTKEVYSILIEEYPDADIALNYSTPLELLVATILSARTTDEQVNKVTPQLFKKYKTAEDYANVDKDELAEDINSIGFYNQKAGWIKASCKKIVEEHEGKVPDTMDDLTELKGVARKTANIVLANAFDKSVGMAIDTHMKRVNYRLGLTDNKKPDKIEQDLMKQLPKEKWKKYTYLIIEHGRAVCKAPTPHCSMCVLEDKCPKQDVNKSK